MRGKNTLVINGKVYDAVTGLPVAAPDPIRSTTPQPRTRQTVITASPQPISPVKTRTPTHAAQAHRVTQKSTTLRRDVLKKPVSKTQIGSARRKPAVGRVARSEQIQRFAAHPQPIIKPAPKPTAVRLDITPVRTKVAPSAIVSQKQALVSRPVASPAQTPTLSSRALKEKLIAERLAAVDTSVSPSKKAHTRRRLFASQPKLASLMSASLAIMLLGGYLTYLNMPGLSVRVAAAQADVAATFPDYHPDGYRFNGPVAYSPGQVAINFIANGGTNKYTVTEQKSTWDSQAVYDNIVAKAADDNYITNSQQGLTIYTYEGEAAWVNKGILYTVHGDAPLSNEQLLHIASSL